MLTRPHGYMRFLFRMDGLEKLNTVIFFLLHSFSLPFLFPFLLSFFFPLGLGCQGVGCVYGVLCFYQDFGWDGVNL